MSLSSPPSAEIIAAYDQRRDFTLTMIAEHADDDHNLDQPKST